MLQNHIAVIGAGIIGIAASIRLQEKGYKVTLIERKEGTGASFNNACVLSESSVIPLSTPNLPKQIPKYLTDKDSPLIIRYSKLHETMPWLINFLKSGNLKSFNAIASSLKSLQRNVFEQHRALAVGSPASDYLTEMPMIYLFADKATYLKDPLSWKTRKQLGVDIEELNCDSLKIEEPELSGFFQWGIKCANHGYISDMQPYLGALKEKVKRNGGEFIEMNVRDIKPSADHVRLYFEEKSIDVDTLLIAAGSHSGKLSKLINEKLPITSEGGYWVDVYEPKAGPTHQMIDTFHKIAITPLKDRLRFAGFAEFGGVEAKPNFRHCDRLKRYAKDIFPNIDINKTQQGYGQRPSTHDSLPVISGSTKSDRIFYACGHQHVGISTAPITAGIITALIAKETPPVDPHPFHIRRFN